MRASSGVFKKTLLLLILVLAVFLALSGKVPDRKVVYLYTTTSVYDSGLLDFLLKDFTSYDVKVIAVGTGEALKNAELGNADVLIVHSPELEKSYLKKGVITKRVPIAYNYFVVVGPLNDPAGVSRKRNALEAFRAIYESSSSFVTRADNSGTYFKEVSIWEKLGLNPSKNPGYFESGLGMAETLKLAEEKGAYTLTDLGTLAQVKAPDLRVFFFPDQEMKNIYSVCLVSSSIIGKDRYERARRLFSYLTSQWAAKKIDYFSQEHSAGNLPPLFKSIQRRGED